MPSRYIKLLLFLIFVLSFGLFFSKPAYASAPDIKGKVYTVGTNSPVITSSPLWVRWIDGKDNVRYTRLNYNGTNDTYYFTSWQGLADGVDEAGQTSYQAYHTWIKPYNPEVAGVFDDRADLSSGGYVRKVSTLTRADCGGESCDLEGFGCGENTPKQHNITVMLPAGWGGSFSQINFDVNQDAPGHLQDNASSLPYTINNISYTPPALTNDASCQSISAPGSVTAGSYFDSTVVMNNPSGHTNWQRSGNYFLGSQTPQDNTNWSFNRLELPNTTANSGSSATFNIRAKAPTSTGKFNFDWQMVQDGVGWFGTSCRKVIDVTANTSPIPNCSNLAGSDALFVGDTGIYTANFSSEQGNLAGEIVVGDQKGNIVWSSGNRSIATNSGSLTYNWVPLQAGKYDVFCRSWNDSIAECRGNSTYVDGPPRYLCNGPTSSMQVNIQNRTIISNCSAQDTSGKNITSITAGQTVKWHASALGGTTYTYSWSGAASGTGADIYQTYTDVGNKTATVTINSAGATITATCSVTVNPVPTSPPPKPSTFSVNNPTAGCDGSNAYIYISWTDSPNTTSYKVDRYRWNGNNWIFQDSINNLPSTTHQYKDPNVTPYYNYSYIITASNANGSTSTARSGYTYTTGCSTFTVSDPIKSCSGSTPYVDLSWSFASSGTTNYYVVARYKYNFSGFYWAIDKSYTVYTTNFRDTEVLSDGFYKYGVSAITTAGSYYDETNDYVYITPCYGSLSVSCAANSATGFTYTYIPWTATATGGSGSYSYDWSGGSGGINPSYTKWNPGWAYYSAPGTYREQVKATSTDGQSSSAVACSAITISRRLPDPFLVNAPLRDCAGPYYPYNHLSWDPKPYAYYYGIEKYYWNKSRWVLQSVIDRSSISYYSDSAGYHYYYYDTALIPNSKYAYRVKAYNNDGYTYGTDYPNWANAGQALACLPATVDIQANSDQGPILIDYNSTANISYTSQNANSCTASNYISTVSGPGGMVDPTFSWSRTTNLSSGNQPSTPLIAYNNNPTVYSLSCRNSYSSATDVVWINLSTPTDLVIDSISPSSSNILAGVPVTFSATVRNIGGTITKKRAGVQTQFNVRFCVDNQNCQTTTTGRVGSDLANTALAFGSYFTHSSSPWTPPATPGPHVAYFCADVGDVVDEPNKGNNCNSYPFSIGSQAQIKTSGGDVHTNEEITTP